MNAARRNEEHQAPEELRRTPDDRGGWSVAPPRQMPTSGFYLPAPAKCLLFFCFGAGDGPLQMGSMGSSF